MCTKVYKYSFHRIITVNNMPSQNIQWFPGHMAKTRRLISENIKLVDVVIELVDARIPYSSKNPEIASLCAIRPVLTLFNKSTLADNNATKKWIDAYAAEGRHAIAIDCVTGDGLKAIAPACRKILADKLERYESKGMAGRKIRAMIVGIPNVGKSSLVNKLSGSKKARVEDRPGVTTSKQWVTTNIGIELLDMPGILWPKFEDKIIGENLAFTGAIKDAILDTETLAGKLCARLLSNAPDKFCTRYKLEKSKLEGLKPHELLAAVARKRGFLISGGELDTERAATIVLDEFRGSKIGRITLELPGQHTKSDKSEASEQ